MKSHGLHHAHLILKNGFSFKGTFFGAQKEVCGELVFNTSMTGYQEVLSDPSYEEQIIVFTAPHIGIVGTNAEDQESQIICAKGMITKEYSSFYSNWRARQSLGDYLKDQNVPGVIGIDTRALVNILRNHGSLWACIASKDLSIEQAQARILVAQQNQRNKKVQMATPYSYLQSKNDPQYHLVVYDFGIKKSILDHLRNLGANLTIVPWYTSFESAIELNPQGVVLSNGPGNPQDYKEAIHVTKRLLESGVPLLGLCLGHQILSLACGASTYKMKEGHHGTNHPIIDMQTNKVYITSQNHNFTVDGTTLPSFLQITHCSLFDGSVQGIAHREKKAIGYQGHPEASPGPHDAASLFSTFIAML